jgi:hypothetical protein
MTTFTVVNSAPVISNITGPTGPLALGGPASVTADFTDADSTQTQHANTSLTWFSVLSNIRLVLLGVRGNGKALAMVRSDFFSIRQARSADSKALQV